MTYILILAGDNMIELKKLPDKIEESFDEETQIVRKFYFQKIRGEKNERRHKRQL